MPVSIRLETPGTLQELERLPDVLIQGPVAEGVEQWFLRDVYARAKRPNYGYTDRTGRLRASTYGRVRVGRSDIVVEMGATMFYAGYVEYRWGGRYSYLRRSLREAERLLGPRLDAAFDRFNRSTPGRYYRRDVRGRFIGRFS